MSKPHPHAELIKAWADGAEIEVHIPHVGWVPVRQRCSWNPGHTFRIKPDPYAVFKEALARGERVDVRLKGLRPGYGWEEMTPRTHAEGMNCFSDRHEHRIALPWQDERDAHDRGEAIEYMAKGMSGWALTREPLWFVDAGEYRVKPRKDTHTCVVKQLKLCPKDPDAPQDFLVNLSPDLELDVEYLDGKIINITLKDWKP